MTFLTELPDPLAFLFLGGTMSAVALIGAMTAIFNKESLHRFLSLFVALASGTLLGGAFFHMLPHALETQFEIMIVMALVCLGFFALYATELLMHWHHCRSTSERTLKPEGVMILIADGLHNLIGGLGIGAGYLIEPSLGLSMWFAAIMHEIPQEMGDYAILLNSGFSAKKALVFNFCSALTFPLGMFAAYGLESSVDVSFLVPFAAGNFIYIAASDLIPQVKEHPKLYSAISHLVMFGVGLFLLFVPHFFIGH